MTAELERSPKKIRIQHGTDAEKSLALAGRINNACGAILGDEIHLRDLFYWNNHERDSKDSKELSISKTKG